MKVDKRNKKIYFYFENQAEQVYLVNAIDFGIKIVKEQKKVNNVSKEMDTKLANILKQYKEETLLEKIEDLTYRGDIELLLILFDNILFIVKEFENTETIIDNIKELVDYLKE